MRRSIHPLLSMAAVAIVAVASSCVHGRDDVAVAGGMENDQMPVDSALMAYISSIRAIDDHAHPMRPVAPGAPPDTEFDALPLSGIPAFAMPARLRLDNPIWHTAQMALYGAGSDISSSSYHDSLVAAVSRVARARGERFPEWALDQAGVDIMLANRIVLAPGLAPPRFRWISFVDALMLPLDTRDEAARTPDTRALYPLETRLLQRYLGDLGVRTLPATLADYVQGVVTPTLKRQRAEGAVAVKFEAAYLRALDFDDPDSVSARQVYARYVRGGVPTRAQYKALQDYLFRTIAREAGRLGMAVQIHVLETFGSYYAASGSEPHLLESAMNDSTLRQTRFVIVHGGWPFVAQTQTLLSKPNVYTDISMMDIILPPSQLAAVLHQWLTEWPEKVLYGSDAFDGGPEQGWEQVAWVGAATARRALAIALTEMMHDGITRERAQAIARMVLRENAATVYGLSAR